MKVRGVARVEITGGDTREFLVTVSPEKLSTYRLDIRQVSDAIEKTNFISSTGLVDNNYQLYLSLVSGLLKNVDEIRAVTVAVQNGVPIKVSDIADVQPSVADKYIRTTAGGRDAVLINIIKQPTGSTVQIGKDVTAEVATLNLSSGVHFENFYDQGSFIMSSIASTRDSIIVGVVLAMVVIFLFLRSWRISLVILLVVPATIASTFACLAAVGLTINIMTLGGIAAAVGLIIDDSIVVIENIFTHFSKGNERAGTGAAFGETTGASLKELMPAIFGSTASTIVIHIPLAFLGGVTGAFFASLSATIVFAMLLSFLFSITLAPLLSMLFIRESEIVREIQHHNRPSSLLIHYEKLLRKLLRYRWMIIPVTFLVVAATYDLYQNIGKRFYARDGRGDVRS